MPAPLGFSWIEQPLLAAMARPEDPDELAWLRQQGIELIVSLTEDPLRRDWLDDAGLLAFHVPIVDMEAPSPEQIDRCLSAIRKAHARGMGVAIHCGAGMGRTGAILACWFVDRGLSAANAIAQVRRLRPGSIETAEQSQAVIRYAQRRSAAAP
ncbi:MAG: dual specificity protein phosphatase 23 [Gemmataceae bacterium]|nr:dual specificity protein phosphatase 23 [Gemmataceae bacterium]MDW8264531.1 dual specificity protein phosphatase 23 [Gemmataceae bacterium]